MSTGGRIFECRHTPTNGKKLHWIHQSKVHPKIRGVRNSKFFPKTAKRHPKTYFLKKLNLFSRSRIKREIIEKDSK